MTRKALARRIAELLFNEPATRRDAGAAPTRRAARILGPLLPVGQRPQRVFSLLAAHPAKIRSSSAATRASDLVHQGFELPSFNVRKIEGTVRAETSHAHSALVARLPAIKLQTNIAGFVIESVQLKLIIELSCRRADFCLERVQLGLAQLNDRCLPGPILRLSKL